MLWERLEFLQSAKLLVHYEPGKEIYFSCDASTYEVWSVFSHIMKDGSEKPKGFASITVTAAENGCSQLDKEEPVIVFLCEMFSSVS